MDRFESGNRVFIFRFQSESDPNIEKTLKLIEKCLFRHPKEI